MWCQRAMFAALLRPLSVAVALHMHVSRTAVVHDHNFVDVPVTVEEEDSVTVRTHLFFQTSISVLSGLCLMTLYLRFLHNILLFRRGVEGGAWRTPGWRSWQTLSSVMVGSFSSVRICHNRRSHGTAAGVADWEAGLGGTRDRNRLTAIASNPCSDRLEGVPGQE